MELIQNAEDNEYPIGVAPSLEFLITSKDITGTGAPSTLLVFNNERGFSSSNIDSICRVGKSTKKGKRQLGYIGEKGIGFKSVFLISSQPHIFSNGYQIRFNEAPSAECDIGYIVPEWVDDNPRLADIQAIYGRSEVLPATTIVLPLKSTKVEAVKQQLSCVHPEMLLFLLKIRRLSVREDDDGGPGHGTVSWISISSELDYQTRKNVHAESYTLHLSAEEGGKGGEQCSYYMWKQRFPVRPESRVEKRKEVDEWVITLAFPMGERLSGRRGSSPGVYAFLPTEMLTGFPFVIQADFLLAASREAILFDSPWNRGILDCVPAAFLNAFVAGVKSVTGAPASTLASMFHFLPVKQSPIQLLDPVRSAIRDKVLAEHIMPCESYTSQKLFCKPGEVGRLKCAFWNVLKKARESGVDLQSLSSHGTCVLSYCFDTDGYGSVLDFLGVQYVSPEWYAKCIEGSRLVKEVPEEVYLELLCFIAGSWSDCFDGTNMASIPLLKRVDPSGGLSFWSISEATSWSDRLCIASEKSSISWLITWNQEFSAISNCSFLPLDTQTALSDFPEERTVTYWLQKHVKMLALSPSNYGSAVVESLNDRRHVIAFAQYLYQSSKRSYISGQCLDELCRAVPVVDNYGNVVKTRKKVLVPAKGSNWVGLMGTNPWRGEDCVELGAEYTSEDQLLEFAVKHLQASDVPHIHPPDAEFPTVLSPLTVDNAFLLLEWIRNLRHSLVRLPGRFLDCVRNGSWLKTSAGYKPPSESFLSSAEWGSLLQIGSVLVDVPMIDREFYRNGLDGYKEELKQIGVKFKFREASAYIGNRLMSMAASHTLTTGNVYALLQLIRFLREKHLSPSELINSIKDGRWLKTSLGYKSPAGCVLYDSEWAVASRITSLPFVDVDFYGSGIAGYKPELELLGVLVSFGHNYEVVVDNFKFNSGLVTAEATVLILECIRYAWDCTDFVRELKGLTWLKTNVGFRAPNASFLVDPEWERLLKVVDGVPLIDSGFYGNAISSYKEELMKTGLIVGFEEASEAIAHRFKQMVSSSSLTKANVLALLESYRRLRSRTPVPVKLFNCVRSEKWLCTSLGFSSPSNAILFDAAWQPLSPIASLPFIDDSDSRHGLGKEIHAYKDELKALGVTVEAKTGVRFVIEGLSIPEDHPVMSATTVMSLLECVRSWMSKKAELPKEFTDKICKKWLKTSMGYQYPDQCILFDPKSSAFIHKEDGPFIDESFYGTDIATYKDVLARIGVTVDAERGCDLVAQHLKCHKQSATISRIYFYLQKYNWKPDNESCDWIWIPSGGDGGQWVSSASCVLRDRNSLFGGQLHVLEKYYDSKLLGFFSLVLGVRTEPNAGDYCKLWGSWESSTHQLTVVDCSAFWEFVAKHWSRQTEELLSGCVTKVPVHADGKIVLQPKQGVFIPDDLLLKDLFDGLPEESLFVWYPSSTLASMSRTKLNDIYRSVGVRTISEAVQKDESCGLDGGGFRTADAGNTVMRRGLLQIVLAFLADPALGMSAEERHQMASHLLDVSVLERSEPITVSYKVALSPGRAVAVKASRMLRWEREDSKLYMQRCDRALGCREKIEFATNFADEITRGLLFERADRIPALAELVRVGCLLDFEVAAVEFWLKTKNLQLFAEDDEFLEAAFPSASQVLKVA